MLILGVAYDEDLANRIRELIAAEPDVSERSMFGGLVFLVGGHVSVAVGGGHTPGQLGLVVEDGDHAVLLAGDASYTEDLMLRGIVDGPSPDDALAQRTHARIRALAAQTPTVYAVAHDPATADRLVERRPIPTELAVAAETVPRPEPAVVSSAV